jgi:hypothetical protein
MRTVRPFLVQYAWRRVVTGSRLPRSQVWFREATLETALAAARHTRLMMRGDVLVWIARAGQSATRSWRVKRSTGEPLEHRATGRRRREVRV